VDASTRTMAAQAVITFRVNIAQLLRHRVSNVGGAHEWSWDRRENRAHWCTSVQRVSRSIHGLKSIPNPVVSYGWPWLGAGQSSELKENEHAGMAPRL